MTNRNNIFSMQSLSHSVYGAQWLREWEIKGARLAGISLYQLMQRAGAAAFQHILWLYPSAHHWLVLVGHGNNGGDGYVVALLAAASKQVTVLAYGDKFSLSAEAAQAKAAWLAAGGEIHSAEEPWPQGVEVIIDALLGTGLKAAPREPYCQIISAANRYPAPVLALDIPSGLMAETGETPGEVIFAAHTVTFIALKPGLLTGKARSVTGQVHYEDLGLGKWLNQEAPLMTRLSAELLPRWLYPRNPCVHKGDNGRLLIVGGDHGFAGAIHMTGEAALRCGAGLVRVLTHEKNIPSLLTARPELMPASLTRDTLKQGLEWADVVVIGPGLGQKRWGKNALHIVKNYDKPMLWDADALNLLAFSPEKHHNRIITPHPGEAARLLNSNVSDIESNRLLAARKLVQCYGGVVVLKGAGTLLASEYDAIAIADVGNAGMASGGMGDVLSGIIGGLLAQKMSLYDAACAGCIIHGATADYLAIKKGTRGMLATDLLPVLYRFVNPELTR